MFANSREDALKAIERMGAAVCAYSHLEWADRCDCKYGVAEGDRPWPTMGERGNGCPELRIVREVIGEMTDDEWSLLVLRFGGVPYGAIAGADSVAARLHRADAAASMAQENIAAIRKALGPDPSNSGLSPGAPVSVSDGSVSDV